MTSSFTRDCVLTPSAKHPGTTLQFICFRLFSSFTSSTTSIVSVGIRHDWNGARPWVRRSRVRLSRRHFLPRYVAFQIQGTVLAQQWSARGMIYATVIVSDCSPRSPQSCTLPHDFTSHAFC